MLGLLPFLTFAGVWLGLARRESARPALIHAAVIVGVFVVILSEALGALRALTLGPVSLAWLFAGAVAVGFGTYRLKFNSVTATEIRGNSVAVTELGGIAVIALVTLFIDLITPPNNWDSMTYHIARVAHWIQNHSFAHYPTSNDRQLYQPPWAEMTILHLKLLAGGDRFVSLVQWSTMIGSVMVVSQIAKRLGASARGQIAAALFCATLPMGILQATSTQNDYAVAFWLVCLMALLLEPGASPVWIGACLGLALLTKGTAWLYAAPLGVWILVKFFRQKNWRAYGVIALAVLIINAGHWSRNFGRYRDPLGPSQLRKADLFSYNNERLGVGVTVSNVIRNSALHLSTPSDSVNATLEAGFRGLLRGIGIDPDDPAATFMRDRFRLIKVSTIEEQSGNQLHFVLILMGTLWLAVATFRSAGGGLRGGRLAVLAAVAAGALMFCFYLKWQPWHSRLHLPLFVMWSPLAGVVFEETRFKRLATAVLMLLLAASSYWLGWNFFRPIFGNERPLVGKVNIFTSPKNVIVFISQEEWREQYETATQIVRDRKVHRLGLLLGGDNWEYPIWTMLGEPEAGRVRIEHMVEDTAIDRNLIPRREPFDAQALIVSAVMERNVQLLGPAWKPVWRGKDLAVYEK